MRRRRSLTCAVGLLLALTACGAEDGADVDPIATYDVFGRPFEPAPALPVQAVLDDPDRYAGGAVMVEGILQDECAQENCWMMMRTDTARLLIRMPGFDAPDVLAGQRAVVHGHMRSDEDGYAVEPTGVMVERARP